MTHKINIVEYSKEHLAKMKPKACHDRELPEEVKTAAITFLHGDDPIAIFGAFILAPGVLEFWGFVSESCRKVSLSFHRSCVELIDHYVSKLRLHRIQITVREDYQEGARWAESLGFHRESTMQKYGQDGSNHHLYVRFAWQ